MQNTTNSPNATYKNCSKCKTPKLLSDFHNNITSKDGKAGMCKICNRSYYKPKTKEQSIRDVKKYALAHPDRVKANWQRYYAKNKDRLNKNKTAYGRTVSGLATIKKSKDKHGEVWKERRRARRKNPTPKQKTEKALRDRFNKVIVRMKSGIKLCSWRDLIGCTVQEAKTHIEAQFLEGMNWGNHGNGEGKWNIDHIIPLVKFNLMDIEEQKKAFHYTNTRPLWFTDNMKRKRKYFDE